MHYSDFADSTVMCLNADYKIKCNNDEMKQITLMCNWEYLDLN